MKKIEEMTDDDTEVLKKLIKEMYRNNFNKGKFNMSKPLCVRIR